MKNGIKTVLVTGASGYIGGRLVPRLLKSGYRVHCLVRHPPELQNRRWPGATVIEGDVLNTRALKKAMEGVDAAYYLIHSMSAGDSRFVKLDEESAHTFAHHATQAGIKNVIYLGGLGQANLSAHLQCRQKVGHILRKEGPPVTEFRAGVIVGSGSLSFEMMRHIVERHPIIPSFSWLRTHCQPIAVRDVLTYLMSSLEIPSARGKIFEIGGLNTLTYEEMIHIYAKRRGLKRLFIPFPCVTAPLCAAWVELTSPIPSGYALPLIESLKNEVVVNEESARQIFNFTPLDYETALRYALLRINEGVVETTWTKTLVPQYATHHTYKVDEGLVFETNLDIVAAPASDVFTVYWGIGGTRGWFYANWLWQLRAFIDRLVGGVGMRRGRRRRDVIETGEILDFWRVERLVKNRLMLLRAEMKVPGKAWLQFESTALTHHRSLIRVTAYFDPKGLWGHAYWKILIPFHKVLLKGMVRAIRHRAEQLYKNKNPPAEYAN